MGVYHDTLAIWLYDRAPAARGQGVGAFFDRFTDLKTEKNGGFRANPLAKYHRLSFFRNLFKDFRKFLYNKMRHVALRTGAAAFANFFYRYSSALLRTEKDKAREDELPVKQGIVNAL